MPKASGWVAERQGEAVAHAGYCADGLQWRADEGLVSAGFELRAAIRGHSVLCRKESGEACPSLQASFALREMVSSQPTTGVLAVPGR